jgi:hypothetical protein
MRKQKGFVWYMIDKALEAIVFSVVVVIALSMLFGVCTAVR